MLSRQLVSRCMLGAVWVGVSAPAALGQVPVRTVALTGAPAAGAGPNVVFERLSSPGLDKSGRATFAAELSGSGVTDADDVGLWRGRPGVLTLLARKGEPAPGFPDPNRFTFLSSVLTSPAGQVAFSGAVTDGTIATWTGQPGSLVPFARSGDPAPLSTAGATFDGVGARALGSGGAVLLSGEASRTTALWVGVPGDIALVAEHGGPVPAIGPDVTFSIRGRGGGPPPGGMVNAGGTVALAARLDGPGITNNVNADVVWAGRAGNLALAARSGDRAPGTPDGTIFGPASPGLQLAGLNDAGQVAVFAGLAGASVTSDTNQGIWVGAPGNLSLVARRGDTAPGAREDARFVVLRTPALNDAGQVAFRSGARGLLTDDEGIWLADAAGVSLIALANTEVPGLGPGVQFSDLGFSDPLINALGQVAFFNRLHGPGIADANDGTLWATDPDGVLRLVAREGDLLEVAPGDFRTIDSLALFEPTAASNDKRLISLNDAGQLLFRGNVSDEGGNVRQGLFIATIPEPTTLALLGVGALTFLRRRRPRTAQRKRPAEYSHDVDECGSS